MTPTAVPANALRRAARDAGYALSSLPIAVLRVIVLAPLFALGIAAAPVLIGLPVLVLALYAARGFADAERLRLGWLTQRPVARPAYRMRQGSGWRRMLTPVTESQSWLDLSYGLVALIPAIVGFAVTLTWWAAGLGGSLFFFWGWSVPNGDGGLPWLLRRYDLPDTYLTQTLVMTGVGLVFLLTAPLVSRAAAAAQSGIVRAMLTADRVAALRQRVDELTGSRAAAVSAEASALRRLERDIHDGPQQRLVRLSMDLSLAQRRMASDPEAAQPLLTEALQQARETLDELRALSRGIAPPVLADRGLAAALTALAGRSTVPVALDLAPMDGERLSDAVENTAYFVVAEALTNVAKHSGASQSAVRLRRDGSLVRVTIEDDGRGGAHLAKGHGLAGIRSPR